MSRRDSSRRSRTASKTHLFYPGSSAARSAASNPRKKSGPKNAARLAFARLAVLLLDCFALYNTTTDSQCIRSAVSSARYGSLTVPLPEFIDQRCNRLVDDGVGEAPLPETDILVVDRLDAPGNDPTLFGGPAAKPTLLGDVDEAIQPGSRRERDRDVLLAVERTSWFERTSQGRASSPLLNGSSP